MSISEVCSEPGCGRRQAFGRNHLRTGDCPVPDPQPVPIEKTKIQLQRDALDDLVKEAIKVVNEMVQKQREVEAEVISAQAYLKACRAAIAAWDDAIRQGYKG